MSEAEQTSRGGAHTWADVPSTAALAHTTPALLGGAAPVEAAPAVGLVAPEELANAPVAAVPLWRRG